MAITRRQFLKRSGLATAGSFLAPGLLANPFIRKALADTIGDRYFVVCYLDGGNDGLNTVTPIDNGTSAGLRTAYEAARAAGSGGLRLSPAVLTPMYIGDDLHSATPLGLHPGLAGLKNLYDLGKVAVVQNVGYPLPNLSHEQSARQWETGVGTGQAAGWVGRYLAANYASNDIPAVNIGGTVAGEFSQNATSVLTFRTLAGFGFPYDYYASGDITDYDAAFAAIHASAAGAALPIQSYLGNAGQSVFAAAQTYPQLDGDYTTDRATWNAQYAALDSRFAVQLREVAKVIYGVENEKVESRFFQVATGGFDTHGGQGGATGNHRDLLANVADSVELFYNDCADMNVADKLCIVIWSEFSRRIQQNANGTDHGTQGPMLVIGGGVNGGIYGNHADIHKDALSKGNTVYSQAAADPHRTTDLRDVYGTLLRHWLGMANPLNVLTLDGGDPDDYWTLPNFEMGFLP